mmetsp:Transcript_3974/g.9414  ORF Transcript_3974/g.9414 Transcript_3974/m.9414 type:complete len:109 (-) Transcript_3974:2089-2415(-)
MGLALGGAAEAVALMVVAVGAPAAPADVETEAAAEKEAEAEAEAVAESEAVVVPEPPPGSTQGILVGGSVDGVQGLGSDVLKEPVAFWQWFAASWIEASPRVRQMGQT